LEELRPKVGSKINLTKMIEDTLDRKEQQKGESK
jgi:hypothetical protein